MGSSFFLDFVMAWHFVAAVVFWLWMVRGQLLCGSSLSMSGQSLWLIVVVAFAGDSIGGACVR